MTLYEINEALRNYEEVFDEETGEWLNEDELNALNMARDEKIEGIACLAKEARADSKALREEAAKLIERADRRDKNADNFEKWLSHELDCKSFVTTRASITFRYSETTDIIEEKMLPAEYINETVKVERKPDKARIKKAIKAGVEIPGATVTGHYKIKVQ